MYLDTQNKYLSDEEPEKKARFIYSHRKLHISICTYFLDVNDFIM